MSINKLGDVLKLARCNLKLTQQEVAQNLCSQPMLSAIENNKYIPNAILLIKICDRLSISLDKLSLSDDFRFFDNETFNDKIIVLCKNHKYKELRQFLLLNSTVSNVKTDGQFQAYYYYLGVAEFQGEQNSDEAEYYFKLALASSPKKQTVLTRLVLISLSYLYANSLSQGKASSYLKQATKDIYALKYEENINIIFFISAFISYKVKYYDDTLYWLEHGIDYISKHDSHYMLANCYKLLAILAKDNKDFSQSEKAQNRSKIFQEIFNEKTF